MSVATGSIPGAAAVPVGGDGDSLPVAELEAYSFMMLSVVIGGGGGIVLPTIG